MLYKILNILSSALTLALKLFDYFQRKEKQDEKASRINKYNSVVDGLFECKSTSDSNSRSSNSDNGANPNS